MFQYQSIYEKDDVNNILILEDFGNLRFDRILRGPTSTKLTGICCKNFDMVLKNDIDYNNSQDLFCL